MGIDTRPQRRTIWLSRALLVLAVSGMVMFGASLLAGARSSDAYAGAFERQQVEAGIANRLVELQALVVPQAIWDQAVVHLDNRFDPQWAKLNIGTFLSHTSGFEIIEVVDRSERPLFVAVDGEVVTSDAPAQPSIALPGLIAAVRAEEARRGPLTPRRPSTQMIAEPIQAVSISLIGGQPYAIVATLVQPDFGTALPAAPRAPIVFAADALDAAFLANIASRYQLINPTLTAPNAPLDAPQTQVMIRDSSDQPLLAVRWKQHQPGTALLGQTWLYLTAVFTFFFLSIVLIHLAVVRANSELIDNATVLESALAAAEKANRAKSQFLANMSHELRTPLNGIIAVMDLLRRRQTDAQAREMTDTVIASGRTLEHVINDILDVSKIEAGQMAFELAPFTLGEVFTGIIDLHAATAASKAIDLTLKISGGTDGIYLGDRTRIGQVISNLVSNAVKFTDTGAVRVTVRTGRTGVCVTVRDTGIGFSHETTHRLFDRFEQADASVNRRFGGTGLGLSICRSLVDIMGGQITVRSIPDRGTVFFTCLPLPRISDVQVDTVDDHLPQTAGTPGGRTLKILFADDHEVNRRVVAMILDTLEIDLTIVENGALAVEAAATSAFDLILMDVQMPVMDGLTATRRIREMEREAGRDRTPIISLTANAMPEDVVRSLDAGSDLHMPKPIRPDALLEAIGGLVSENRPSAEAIQAA